MCNPPFYGSKEEVVRSAEMKEYGANSVGFLQNCASEIHTYPLDLHRQ